MEKILEMGLFHWKAILFLGHKIIPMMKLD
jgi:hypothetical protein